MDQPIPLWVWLIFVCWWVFTVGVLGLNGWVRRRR